jgi:hypothetical protein
MSELTATRLREVLSYDRLTGEFVWLMTLSNRALAGSAAGSFDKARGYLTIGVEGRLYQAHRLAWLYVTGEWPIGEIDHWDTNKLNNKWVNLRDVTFSMNQQNVRRPRSHNTSGYQGVVWDKRKSKWRAGLTKGGKFIYLGYFDDPAVAHQAYVAGKRIHHEGNTL